MIKLIATDIDGTILKQNFEFNQEVKDCISELTERDVKVVLVTGRMYAATVHVAEELKLTTPIVSYQGGLVKDNNKTLYERHLDAEKAKEVVEWARENNVHTNLYLNDELYVEKDSKTVRQYVKQGIKHFNIKSFDEVEFKSVNKIILIDYDDAEKVTAWEKYLQETYPDLCIIKSTPHYCEICHPEATKFHAVDFLRQHWGLKQEEVMTIGDQNNDLGLLKAGGVRVAMGNATPELKAVANYVTETIDNNGFVKAVEQFVYNKIEL